MLELAEWLIVDKEEMTLGAVSGCALDAVAVDSAGEGSSPWSKTHSGCDNVSSGDSPSFSGRRNAFSGLSLINSSFKIFTGPFP